MTIDGSLLSEENTLHSAASCPGGEASLPRAHIPFRHSPATSLDAHQRRAKHRPPINTLGTRGRTNEWKMHPSSTQKVQMLSERPIERCTRKRAPLVSQRKIPDITISVS